jgi:hypothetical protein
MPDKKSDLSLTRIDMHPPTPEDFDQFGERRKTDPIGQIVTGEFDNVTTPELIPIELDIDAEIFDSQFAVSFAMGVGLGICGFVVAYMILCAVFGMK